MSEATGAASELTRLLDPIRADPAAAALLFDIDGTLAAIVPDPEDAAVPAETRDVLRELAARFSLVACVTGRRALEARRMVGVEELTYSGNHGLRAQQDLDQQFATLSEELGRLKQERAAWQRRVKLLQSSSIDPDTLDERARAVLNYVDPRDLTLMLKRP